RRDHVRAPWPGVVPDPAPATVHDPPLPAEVLDAAGRPVRVDGRGEVSAPPAAVAPGGQRAGGAAWGGPGAHGGRAGGPGRHRRRARLQVATAGGAAHLLAIEGGRWWVEATYD